VRETPSVTCVFWLWRHQSRISSLHLIAAQSVAKLLQVGVSRVLRIEKQTV